MQTQAQHSGQVPGCLPLQSRGSIPSQASSGGWSKTWHAEDVSLRKGIVEQILHLVHKWKPQLLSEQQKIPDFVRLVEETMYREATSKEDYADLYTLEHRFKAFAPRVLMSMSSNLQQPRASSLDDHVHASPSVSAMVPTPMNGGGMVPTPGIGTNMITTGSFNHMIPTPGIGNGTSRTSGGMIPTPGLANKVPFSGGIMNGSNMGSTTGQTTMFQPSGTMMPTPGTTAAMLASSQTINGMRTLQNNQMASGGGLLTSGNRFHTSGSQQLSTSQNVQFSKIGTDASSGQIQQFGDSVNGFRTGLNNGQSKPSNLGLMNGGLMLGSRQNGNMGVHESVYQAQYRNSQLLSQQRLSQQQARIQSSSISNESYAMNASDLPGSLHGSVSTGLVPNNIGINNLSTQVPNMISVPGLPSQQQSTQVQNQLQQSQYQQISRDIFSQNSRVQHLQQQQQQQQQLQHLQRQQQQLQQAQQQQPQQVQLQQQQQLQLQQQQQMQQQAQKQQQVQQQQLQQHQQQQQQQLQLQQQQQLQLQQQQQMQQQHAKESSSQDIHKTQVETHLLEDANSQQQCLQQEVPDQKNQLLPLETQEPAVVKAEEQSLSSECLQPPAQSTTPPSGNSCPQSPITNARAKQYLKQQRWLLFLRHASKCTNQEKCTFSQHCHEGRELLHHMASCKDHECTYARCAASRGLVVHHIQCRDVRCPVCGPVRHYVHRSTTLARGASEQGSLVVAGENGSSPNVTQVSSNLSPGRCQPPPMKRAKAEPVTDSKVKEEIECMHVQAPISQAEIQILAAPKVESQSCTKPEWKPVKLPQPKSEGQVKSEIRNLTVSQRPGYQTKVDHTAASEGKAESGTRGSVIQVKQESKAAQPGHKTTGSTKTGKPKLVGVSLTELFTPDQIREHIAGLRQWVGQTKAKAEKNQAQEHQMKDSACPLCAVERLTFDPPPIYCTSCGIRIKRNASYYTTAIRETRHYFCIPCYNDVRGETVEMEGQTYPKSSMEKRKHDEETEEAWVQCDKCERWQHQVCALFNSRRNEGGEAEYTCPQCCMAEMERGERKSLPPSAVLGAKDLPTTTLSNHLESRLRQKLEQERTERARAQGKKYDEVPGAEPLVIRVVSSVDKRLEVKQRFLEIFQEEDYPTEFAYKSKAVLLFQKIEGVEVCLFGMYVQEFGAECSQPNQRRVYLSYLDSVKYFRPDVKTLSGEALRTYVYHELLIGYLDYCKCRGFSSCYIWACPPLKGEDYILYCHPEIQKTPKSDKLREWYLTMLKKAARDMVVVEVTNLYDYFFKSEGECKAKVTAARLPYFDGDYWPGAAEDMILQLQQEDEDGKQSKKGKIKKLPTKRSSKAAAQAEMAANASKDLQLMHKLGESIVPMKEDFIMVHMHYSCTHCRQFITSGHRWACRQQCKNFNICDRCYAVEQSADERDRHPMDKKEKHQLYSVSVNDVSSDTRDIDDIMESEFFDTRHAFLSLCQGNHYQYDTLRRAKHSSMMVLYHLHNPMAPAFVTTCCLCSIDMEAGQGWRCETCTDFDLCNACYQKDEAKRHPHKLIQPPRPSASERNAQNKEARQKRVKQLRQIMDLLVHASECGIAQCSYPKCHSLKALFRHGLSCSIRSQGGCAHCKQMWYFLHLHARSCNKPSCRVPRCKDLKEHLRRLQKQMESRRRAAVNEMMRQRAAETANGRS